MKMITNVFLLLLCLITLVASLSLSPKSYMKIAMIEAKKAYNIGEVPVGAVVFLPATPASPEIISSAHNLVESTFDATAHAELLALRATAQKVGNWRLINATVFTTLEPCVMCIRAMEAFRVKKVVYAGRDHRLGGVESCDEPFPKNAFHSVETEALPLDNNFAVESSSLMKSFFRARR